jgi:hypothetical protein
MSEEASTEVTEVVVPAVEARSPERFWRATEGVDALSDPRPYGQENALQKLGRPPFEKSARSKFRVLGYLATVYEHGTSAVMRRLSPMRRPARRVGWALWSDETQCPLYFLARRNPRNHSPTSAAAITISTGQ